MKSRAGSLAMLSIVASAVAACREAMPTDGYARTPPSLDAGSMQVGVGEPAADASSSLDTGLAVDTRPVTGAGVTGPVAEGGISQGQGNPVDAGRLDAAAALDASTSLDAVVSDAHGEAGPAPISCSGTTSIRTGDSSGTLQFGGTSRSYRVYVPASYKPDTPVPLVLWFHGILGSGQDYRTSGFREVADSAGFILVAPDGIDSAWNIGPCCTARRRNVDDVGFAKALVNALKQKACIDATRVYATGFSMGGGLSHYLACHAADVFAATAPSAFDLLEENVDDCKPTRAISVASFRNTFDAFVYYDGVSDSQPPNTSITGDTSVRINILGAEATLAAWARIDGCTGSPVEDGPGCKTYEQCRDGSEVTLCTEDDVIGGHKPGPADQMWEHLRRYRLP